jgi:hypothetical protein
MSKHANFRRRRKDNAMPRTTNRNYEDAPPMWQDRDPSPHPGPKSTDGGSLDTPATAGKQPMREDRGIDD